MTTTIDTERHHAYAEQGLDSLIGPVEEIQGSLNPAIFERQDTGIDLVRQLFK